MASQDIILELESDNGKLFKQNVIEREAKAGNDELFEGLMLGLHPLTTFGVKQVPESTVASTDPQRANWSEFVDLADELKERNLTGHAARDAIHDLMLKSGQSQWDAWFRRIILQDMKAGFSESTVNKAVTKANTPKYGIPVFSCQLATDSELKPKKMVGKKQVDIKLDGVRLLSILKEGKAVKQTSRSGREMVNFGHTAKQLEHLLTYFDRPMVLDGEIMSSNFQDLMTQVQRQSNVDAGDAVLNIFDLVPLDEFLAGESVNTQSERTAELMAIKAEFGDVWDLWFPNINILESEVVDLDTAEGKARLEEINKMALEGGYEGIMLKDVDATYKCKRTTDWMKLKPYIELDLEITALYKGNPETKNENRLGGFTCVGEYEMSEYHADMFDLPIGTVVQIEVDCGGGFTDKQRDEFWAEGSKLHKMIVEVRADAPTKSDSKDTYSLRFPRFKRFRGFVAGEKI